jgi:hypothetical protein
MFSFCGSLPIWMQTIHKYAHHIFRNSILYIFNKVHNYATFNEPLATSKSCTAKAVKSNPAETNAHAQQT